MADETRISPAEREKINFEVSLIGKMIEAREAKGISQREPLGIVPLQKQK